MKSILILSLILSFCAPEHGLLTEEEVKDDLNFLENELFAYHPGVDRYTSLDSLKLLFHQEISDAHTQPIAEFFQRVSFLLAQIHCGHTGAKLPEASRMDFEAAPNFLPVEVRFFNGNLYVVKDINAAGHVFPGDRITSINGRSMPEIKRIIFAHLSGDGFITSGHYRICETAFAYYYRMFVEFDAETFKLEVVTSEGAPRVVKLAGRPYSKTDRILAPTLGTVLMKVAHYASHSYLRIGTFSEYHLRREGFDYEAFLADAFDAFRERGTEKLILDLRGNGGGKDDFGALLVSYLAPSQFRYFDEIQVTNAYDGYGTIAEDKGKNLLTSHRGLRPWDPMPLAFDGEVYVLIDGYSFSTCADVAAVLHHNRWAIFFGEETGGGYDGNTSGAGKNVILPNSRIEVYIPMWKYTTANSGHRYSGRGVLPDYPIALTIDQYLGGEDAVLDSLVNFVRMQ